MDAKNNSEELASNLLDIEKVLLKELLKNDAVLSFNEKGMVQIFNPKDGLKFIDMGDEIIQSLERKDLITLIESRAWEVREYRLSTMGKKIASNLSKCP